MTDRLGVRGRRGHGAKVGTALARVATQRRVGTVLGSGPNRGRHDDRVDTEPYGFCPYLVLYAGAMSDSARRQDRYGAKVRTAPGSTWHPDRYGTQGSIRRKVSFSIGVGGALIRAWHRDRHAAEIGMALGAGTALGAGIVLGRGIIRGRTRGGYT